MADTTRRRPAPAAREEAAPEKTYTHDYTVKRVKVFDNGGVIFDLGIDDVTVYGCGAKNTKTGIEFISFPQRKGTDGKYYSHAYINLDDSTIEKILDRVYELADGK